MIDNKYTTLVFRAETEEEKRKVRELSQIESCRAWMLDHALLKLDLIEKAVEERDFERAEKYFSAIDITEHQHELEDNPRMVSGILSA